MLMAHGVQCNEIEPKQLMKLLGRGAMPTFEQVPSFRKPDKVEELSWLLNSKECDEADGYAITCKVIENIAKGRANGTDSTDHAGKFLRHINKTSNTANQSTMSRNSIIIWKNTHPHMARCVP